MLFSILILILITYFLIELNHQFRTVSPLIIKPKEYKKHMEAKAYARKQQEKFDKKYS